MTGRLRGTESKSPRNSGCHSGLFRSHSRLSDGFSYRLTATLDSSLSAPDDLNTHADNPPTTLAWQAAAHGVAKSQTRLSDWTILASVLWTKVKVSQSCPILCNPMDYTVHGILQARILGWVAFPFSRGSSQPRDQTQVSHTAGGFFTSWATREVPAFVCFFQNELILHPLKITQSKI